MKHLTKDEQDAWFRDYAKNRRAAIKAALSGRNPYEVALAEHADRIDRKVARAKPTSEGCLVIRLHGRVLDRPKLDGVGPSPLLLARLVAVKHGKAGHDDPVVRHTCDNVACINPDHLIGGTHQDNMQDMVDRGRQAKPESLPGRPPKAVIAPDGARWPSPEAAAAALHMAPDTIRVKCRRHLGGWRYATL